MWSSHHKEPVEVVLEFIYFYTMSYWEEAPHGEPEHAGEITLLSWLGMQ